MTSLAFRWLAAMFSFTCLQVFTLAIRKEKDKALQRRGLRRRQKLWRTYHHMKLYRKILNWLSDARDEYQEYRVNNHIYS
jgi:hypothetical protein